jgi:hypothetical protein
VAVTKRYREPLDRVVLDSGRSAPVSFGWRGRRFRVSRIVGHWREDPGWWRGSDGRAIRIEQADLWRVEVCDGVCEHTAEAGGDCEHAVEADGVCEHPAEGDLSAARHGVFEIVRRGGSWRLERVWD